MSSMAYNTKRCNGSPFAGTVVLPWATGRIERHSDQRIAD
jgi:hypothetical protein